LRASDPFAAISFGGGDERLQTHKTKTIYKTLEPVWNESFTTSLNSHPDQLYVDIFDYDLVGMNDFLGRAKIPIASIQPDSTVDEWYDLGYKIDPNATNDGGAPVVGGASVTQPSSKPVALPSTAGTYASASEEGSEVGGEGGEASGEETTKKKKGLLGMIKILKNQMHDLVEKGMDFLRGPEEGITGSVHLKITRRPRDLGSVHLKIVRRDREPFTRVFVVELVAGRNLLGADKGGDSGV
jgi:hypothetical protein